MILLCPELSGSCSRCHDFIEDMSWVPSSLETDAIESLAFLKHLCSDFDEIHGLGLNNDDLCLTTVWVMRAMALAARKRWPFILWVLSL